MTYGKIWLPVFVAFTLCAFVVRRRRSPVGLEKWAWRLVLVAGMSAHAARRRPRVLDAVGGDERRAARRRLPGLDAVPGLLTMLASTFLGIVLLRRRAGLPRYCWPRPSRWCS